MTSFTERVRSGEEVSGIFLKLSGLESVDLLARAGFDFGVIDLEHSQLETGDASRMVRHSRAVGLPLVVRLPEVDSGSINRLLEAGAAGIQLSCLTTSRDASALRASMRYAPHGTRSVSSAQPAAGYGALPLAEYLEKNASDPPLVIGQVETAKTDDALEELFRHLDLVFLGTTDLSVDLGVPGQLGDPAVSERMRAVAGAAREAGIALGGFAGSPEGTRILRELGATYLVTSSDLQVLQQGLMSLGSALENRRSGTG